MQSSTTPRATGASPSVSSLTTGLPDTRNVCDWLGASGRRFAVMEFRVVANQRASVRLAFWDRDDSGRLTFATRSNPWELNAFDRAATEAHVLASTMAHALATDSVTGEARATMLYRLFWHLYRRHAGIREMVRQFAPTWAAMVADAIEVGR